ncbi:putative iron-sulfur binding oxidoreductase [Zafaria cholistanensis]|uniref:Putative iron-sulfur binding oxidoreductase n=1 Tax=Zafaria cholistanensis TaxID=1682741 RepID=A0A5A7NQF4_9MICC|nr:FAD-dependent oxidoreductase [Zafaria cholistanensis]GER23093.1 putative iron-sulfur binding oxidoreductase [Zafaria cholistanensis]
MTGPLWMEGRVPPECDALPRSTGEAIDTIVVGAGITGLCTALMLLRAGQRVVVLEARHPGAVTTGHTTAKVTALHGGRAGTILRRHGPEVAQAYVRANADALEWLVRLCNGLGVDMQARRAVTYAQTTAGKVQLEDDLRVLEAAGQPAVSLGPGSLEVPFPFAGAVGLEAQRQFDPMDFVSAAVAEVRRLGGTVVAGARVLGVSSTGTPTVRIGPGRQEPGTGNQPGPSQLQARRVVMATGIPTLLRGLIFTRVLPERSYILAYRRVLPGTTELPRDMLISVDGVRRSLRTTTSPDGAERLLVGGASHTVGRDSGTVPQAELRAWAKRMFPGLMETHAWSAQDYSPVGGLPMAGPLGVSGRGANPVLFASGFAKWGMTNGVAAAMQLARLCVGGPTEDTAPSLEWAGRLYGRHLDLEEVGETARLNAGIASRWFAGSVQRTTPRCTHLGGRLRWNAVEQSWDCPLHGSRFAPDGCLLEGPATRNLPPRPHNQPPAPADSDGGPAHSGTP